MKYFLNPKRARRNSLGKKFKYWLTLPLVRLLLWLGFPNQDYSSHDGYDDRLTIGDRCSTMNTYFNTNSGTISVGDDTIFGVNVMIITGQHRFVNGRRAYLQDDIQVKEVPDTGNDIRIGSGCFICSGSILIKNVTVGNNVLLGSGSVVTKDIPDNCFACGVPAEVKKYFKDEISMNEFKETLQKAGE